MGLMSTCPLNSINGVSLSLSSIFIELFTFSICLDLFFDSHYSFYIRCTHIYILTMFINLLIILFISLAPLTASLVGPMALQDTVDCYNVSGVLPASVIDCTNLLTYMDSLPRFHIKTIYTTGLPLNFNLASCEFQLRAKLPESGISERIRLVNYWPAFRQITDQCLDTSEEYNSGRTDVGQHFWASLGADSIIRSVRNETVARGGVATA